MSNKLIIAGLGPGDPGMLPVRALEALRTAGRVLVRTERHPVVPRLKDWGITYEALDRFYEQADDFEAVYRCIADYVMQAARVQGAAVIYAVPGHPMVAESSVRLLLERAAHEGLRTEVIPAMSCLDAVYATLQVDPARGVAVLDALDLTADKLNPGLSALITQFYNRRVASEVKLTLMERYPDDYPVTVVRGAGVPGGERVERVPLYEVDRLEWLDHLTTLYLQPLPHAANTVADQPNADCAYPLDPLVEVMATLRGEGGCPWDREQSHRSIKRYLLEEAYEAADAIETLNMHNLCEELGDLLLQVVFHAQMAWEAGVFDINDVVRGITEKMLRRHPHVFGEAKADTADQVLVNWEQIKADEKGSDGQSVINVPRALPALVKAEKVQRAAARVGFDWPDLSGPWAKVVEELEELQQAGAGGQPGEMTEELGDLLFAVVNVARFLQIDPEDALSRCIDKFIRRFQYIEAKARDAGHDLPGMTLAEMDLLWEESKKLDETWKILR